MGVSKTISHKKKLRQLVIVYSKIYARQNECTFELLLYNPCADNSPALDGEIQQEFEGMDLPHLPIAIDLYAGGLRVRFYTVATSSLLYT